MNRRQFVFDVKEIRTQVWFWQKPNTLSLTYSVMASRIRHGFLFLGCLDGDWSFLSRFAPGLLGNDLVFCLDEFHEGPQLLRVLEGEACPGPFPDLVTEAPVNRLVFR